MAKRRSSELDDPRVGSYSQGKRPAMTVTGKPLPERQAVATYGLGDGDHYVLLDSFKSPLAIHVIEELKMMLGLTNDAPDEPDASQTQEQDSDELRGNS